MPNGKMHKKPPKRLSNRKKAEKMSEAETFGKLKAQDRWKRSKKGIMNSLRAHIGKALDRTPILTTAAVLSGTYLLYNNVGSAVASLLNLGEDEIKNNVAKFCVAFFTSYILVKHFGNIAMAMAEVGGGLLDILKWSIITQGLAGKSTFAFWTLPTTLSIDMVALPQGAYEAWAKTQKLLVSP